MTHNPIADIEAIYAELPAIECRGLCQQSCGPIEMSKAERERAEGKLGRELRFDRESLLCDALTPLGTCSIYAERPMICRLWGLVESMPCPYGCVPEGGPLSEEEGYRRLGAVNEIGGAPDELSLLRLAEDLGLARGGG